MTGLVLSARDVVAPPLQPAAGPSGMGATSAQWLCAEDWPAVFGDWQALAAQSAPNAFLMPAFALAARAADPSAGLGAIVVMRDGRWLGFVPGRVGLQGAAFSVWVHDYAPYGGPLVVPGEERTVVAALLGFLDDRRVTALDWPMLDDGAVASALEIACAGRRTVILDRHARACLVDLPPKPSKDHRRLARRLAEVGTLEQVSTASGLPVGEAIAAFLGLEAAGWKGRRGTALAAAAATREFFVTAFQDLATAGMARIDLFRLDGRPIAAGVSLIAGDRAWYLKTAYDETFARFSPGVLLSHSIGEQLMACGTIRLVDSCAIPGHSMIDRIWPGRIAMTRRLIAVRPGDAGWRFRAVLALRRAQIEGKAIAKRLLKR
jgi:CelD/BcsL family acetyltransferase involved in cellulose biosynthesis